MAYGFGDCILNQISNLQLQSQLSNMQLDQGEKNSSEHFFKEIKCLDFTLEKQPRVQAIARLYFQQQGDHNYCLPSTLLDAQSQQPTLYVLQWRQGVDCELVYLRTSKQTQWKLIQMSRYPQKVLISDSKMYLFTKNQLFIIELTNLQRIVRIPTYSDVIVDAQISYNQHNYPQLYPVFFHPKRGYFARTYSQTTKGSFFDRLSNIFSPFYPRHQQHQFFKVIIPNIIAITIDNNTLQLYDLHTMANVAQFKLVQLKVEAVKTIVRWKIGKPIQGYTDGLQLFIARGNTIEVVCVCVKRKQFRPASNKNLNQPQDLSQYSSGDVVDWTQCCVSHKQKPIQVEGTISHLQLIQNELLFRWFRPTLEEIPVIELISLDNPTQRISNFICQEASVWKQYYCGHSTNSQDMGEVNRNGKKYMKQNDSRSKELVEWRKQQSFEGFQLNNQTYIVRKNSISILDPIDKFQYLLDEYSPACFKEDEKQIQGLTYLQNIERKLLNMEDIEKLKHLHNIVNDIKRLANGITIQPYNRNQDVPSPSTYYANSIRDKLTHYSQYFQYCKQVLKVTPWSLKNRVIIGIVISLAQTYSSKQCYQKLGLSLLDFFVVQMERKSCGSEFGMACLFESIFQNVLPDTYAIKMTSGLSENKFLEYLIRLILDHQKDQSLLEQLVKVVKNYFGYFTQMPLNNLVELLSQNNSLFQAYLLSHPNQKELQTVLEVIMSSPCEKLLKNLRKIEHLISNQLSTILDVKIKVQHLDGLSRQLEILEETLTPPRLSQKVKVKKRQLSGHLVLYSHEQRFNKNFNEIVNLFDRMRKESCQRQSLYAQIVSLERRQIELDVLSQDNKHILQLEETMLRNYTSLFNQAVLSQCKIARKQASTLLELILGCFQMYSKHFKMCYKVKQKVQVSSDSYFPKVTRDVCEDEDLMSSSMLLQPILIANLYCSRVSISLLTILIEEPRCKGLTKEDLNFITIPEMAEMMIKMLMEDKRFKRQYIDMLYYFLIKMGESQFKSLFKAFTLERIEVLVSQLEIFRVHGVMIRILNELTGIFRMPRNAYINPFSVTEQ